MIYYGWLWMVVDDYEWLWIGWFLGYYGMILNAYGLDHSHPFPTCLAPVWSGKKTWTDLFSAKTHHLGMDGTHRIYHFNTCQLGGHWPCASLGSEDGPKMVPANLHHADQKIPIRLPWDWMVSPPSFWNWLWIPMNEFVFLRGGPKFWGYPQIWIVCKGKSDSNGWFSGTPILGNFQIGFLTPIN